MRAAASLLRWYPPAWRARYGEELVALMEDSHPDRRLPVRTRLAVAVGGVRERGHEAGLLGGAAGPERQARAGSLLVLGAWTACIVAGAAFQKVSEHYDAALPRPAQSLPTFAFDAVVAAAAIGGVATLAAAAVAVPAFVRFVRAGGWSSIRRRVVAAAAVSLLSVGMAAALSGWAHSLSIAARNGGDGLYTTAFVAWALVTAAALASWTAAAVAATNRIELSRDALAVLTALALLVTAAMVVVTAATALWWGQMALHAPWVLDNRIGPQGTPFNLQLAGAMGLMFASVLVAAPGAVRAGRAGARLLRTDA